MIHGPPPPVAPDPDPDAAASQAELRDALQAALVRLAQREREAFILVELEGSSTLDAAESLGVGPSTVRSLPTLARRCDAGAVGNDVVRLQSIRERLDTLCSRGIPERSIHRLAAEETAA